MFEEFFIKEYEEQKKAYTELEKNKKLVEIELKEKQKLIKEIADFFKESAPYITENGYLYLSVLVGEEKKDKALNMLNKLGITIKEQT